MNKRLGRYELRKAIGRGAAGTVWEAWDSVLDRRVAVKVVRASDRDAPEFEEMLTRFRQEAQLASRFSHPGVVQVHDYGEIDGEAFIVMEFVDGETLHTLLNRSGKLPLRRAAEIIRGVLLALEPCHRQSIVHRDIKPGNIMLPADGGVKLADFGIARMENSELTIVGTVMGTPPYMSPEQFTAKYPVDFRSDIWSCGVMLYEMLTGSRPFTGNTMATIGQAVVNDPFEPPSHLVPGLPAALDLVLERALRKTPGERFPGAEAFWNAIESALPVIPVRPASGGKLPVVLGIAGAVLVAAAAGGWFLSGGQTKPAAQNGSPGARGAPSGAEPVASVPAQVAALPCSTVRAATEGGVTSFQGVIGSGPPRAALDEIVAQLPATGGTVSVQTFPYADVPCRFAELVRKYAGDAGARLTTNGGRTVLYTNEAIRLRLIMPDFEGEVRLEDLNSDDRVGHLMEANAGSLPRLPPGALVGLGRGGDDLIGRVSAPYGTDLLVAVVSSESLFSGPRPLEEAGGAFIGELDAAMAALRRRGGHVAADALVLTTVRR